MITQQPSGAPGENIRIWVRGGSDILYVIDDVVMETEQGNEFLVTAKSRDYDLMQIRKDEFIGLFGNGPFNNILPLDRDGKVIEKKLPNKVRILK